MCRAMVDWLNKLVRELREKESAIREKESAIKKNDRAIVEIDRVLREKDRAIKLQITSLQVYVKLQEGDAFNAIATEMELSKEEQKSILENLKKNIPGFTLYSYRDCL